MKTLDGVIDENCILQFPKNFRSARVGLLGLLSLLGLGLLGLGLLGSHSHQLKCLVF